MTKEKKQPLATKLSQFVNIPRALKTMMSLLASDELTAEEREDIVIICSFLIDEHLGVVE